MDKRSQVTLFVIMGALIIGTLAFFYFMKGIGNSTNEDSTEFSVKLSDDPVSFENYIETCIREEAKPLLREMALNGGTLSKQIARLYNNLSYTYLCIDEQGNGCVNTLQTRWTMERELSEKLLEKLPYCIDMDNFKSQGYSVTEGDMKTVVTIGSDTITVNLNYPLKISKDNFNFERDKFSITHKSNFGKLYDLAVNIVDSEIDNKYFDKDAWMLSHGAYIEIEKHRPYPDIIYSLRKYDSMTAEFLTFNFALQGEDTAARVDNPKGSQQFLGYCYIERDSNCYANSHRAECEKQKGVWSKAKPENCKGISDYGMGCENDACKDCGSRKHGETWCEYDGITGNGLDYVGARHYQRSCFDGKVYHEECRDYREEICVQDTKKAQCRVNRWEDCVLQSDADSCTDSEKRDCKWDYSLKKSYVGFYESKRCYPIVPPGFKHWQNNGWLVCQMANEQNDCDGAVCPAVWVDSSARYCYSMGDCGGYRNIADEVSKGGYINTQGPPRDYVYLSPGLSDEGQDYVLNLNTGSTKREPLDNPYENPHDNLNEVLRRVSEYTDETSSWSKDDFIWQYIWEGEIDYWVRHTAFCGMWQAPSGGQCNLCHADKNKPCTEYRCKSLGSACIYEEVDGYGRCFNEHRNDHTAPRIDLDQTKLTKNYTSEKDYLAGYNGWKVSPGVYPHTIVRFGIKTSEDTQCKISMLPGLNYTAITWPTGNFSQEHEIIYRMPDTNQIIGYFKDSTKLLSLIQMSKLDEINSLIEKIKRDAQETAEEFDVDASAFIAKISEVQEKFNGEVRPSISAFLDTMQNAISNLMAEIEARRHVVFIKCIDRAGNQNEQDVFVKFDVNEDTVPPAISDVQKILAGDHAQVRFSVNEDAECRYSLNEDKQFDEMRDTFECMSRFDSSVMFYYTCFAEVPAAAQKTTLYVKCKDKPAKTKNYALQLTSGMNTSVISTKYPNLVLINDSFINVTNDYALLSNDTKISSTYAKMRLGINFDISVACGLGNETMKQVEKYPEQMTCTKGYCEKELDIYERTVYIGCVNKAISQRVINDESIVIEIKPD